MEDGKYKVAVKGALEIVYSRYNKCKLSASQTKPTFSSTGERQHPAGSGYQLRQPVHRGGSCGGGGGDRPVHLLLGDVVQIMGGIYKTPADVRIPECYSIKVM